MLLTKLHWRDYLNSAFLGELAFFCGSQFLAILVLIKYLLHWQTTASIEAPNLISPFVFLAIFAVLSLILYFVINKTKKPWLIGGFFYLALAEGLFFVIRPYTNSPAAYLLTIAVLLIYLLVYTIAVHDFVLSAALSGIGILLSQQFTPSTAIIVLIALAIYDFIAVNKTKHMVGMFTKLVSLKLPLALIIPYDSKNYNVSARLVSINSDYMFLGTGDIVVPMLLILPTFISNPRQGLFTLAGSVLGLIILYTQFLLRTERKALPGLPAIVFGTLAGYFIGMVL